MRFTEGSRLCYDIFFFVGNYKRNMRIRQKTVNEQDAGKEYFVNIYYVMLVPEETNQKYDNLRLRNVGQTGLTTFFVCGLDVKTVIEVRVVVC